jgi:hypothetical protein
MRQLIALLIALTVLGHSVAAESASDESSAKRVGLAVASGLGTVVYTPLKGLLCLMGGTSAALAFLSSGPGPTRAVATEACGGTWVLTPAILEGKESLDVIGELPCCGYPE